MVPSGATLTRALLTGLAAAVLVFPVLVGLAVFGRPTWWHLLGTFLGLVGLVAAGVLYRRSRREGDSGGESVWDVIPGWQYEGRHVESGGLARNEQEQALREIRERAEREERRP
jgi:hypothetical protein